MVRGDREEQANREPTGPVIKQRTLVHQEGMLGLLAVIGLLLREQGPEPYLMPQQGGWLLAISGGLASGLGIAVLLWLLRVLPPVRAMETWFVSVMRGWTVADALALALISGIAEEALLRALLQPLIGLVPASLLFALLHVIPDRRLWFWPVMALVLGVVLGLLYQRLGYPAAAAAHVAINAVGLVRLSRLAGPLESTEP